MNEPHGAARSSPAVCLGFLRRRHLWLPTWRGWLFLAALAVLGLYSLRGLYGFLAVNDPPRGRLLLVEGWVPYHGIVRAQQIFVQDGFEQLVTLGGPLDHGMLLEQMGTYAAVAARTLKQLGMPPSKIVPVPSPPVIRDRTYTCALAFHEWLNAQPVRATEITIVSQSVHARRTRLLFQLALGDDVRVAVVGAEEQDYDPRAWWKYSAGIRDVIEELLAYVYTRFFFIPWHLLSRS